MSKNISEQQANIFKALGHTSRLMMVKALGTGDKCVCELHSLVGGDLSTISKHLTVLKNAGVVETYKNGNFVIYHLKLQCLASFINCLENASGCCSGCDVSQSIEKCQYASKCSDDKV